MKLMKCLLLAAPATLVAAAAAQAADLPANKSAPVTYVKVCDAYGAGFFYIPGTDTCLHVGGYVRFETRYTPSQNIINAAAAGTAASPFISQASGAQDSTGSEIRGRIDVDARNQTQWGTLQEVVRIRSASTYGMGASSKGGFTTAFTPSASGTTGSITMERAYFRFAGLTAGIADSNFTTMPSVMLGPTEYAGFPNGVPQLAYTAVFGGGFSATIAAEERNAYGNGGALTSGLGTAAPYTYSVLSTTQQNSRFTGEALVGNLRYDASWGYIQVNGAVDSNQFYVNQGITGTATPATYQPLQTPSSQTGYAAGFSFKVNLPMLAPGDSFSSQFAYERGIIGLVHSSGSINDGSDSSGANREVGGVIIYPQSYIVTSVGAGGVGTATVAPSTGFQIYGVLTHHWTPSWRSNFQVGYQSVNNPVAAASAGLQAGNLRYLGTGANLIWSPIKDFDIGVELDYLHTNNTLQNAPAAYLAAGSPGLSGGNWSGILRLERQF